MNQSLVNVELTEGKVEFEPGIVKNVGVLGHKSKNGRTYSVDCMKKAVASRLYEGFNIYLDHEGKPTPSRRVAEHFGRIEGVYYDDKAKRVRAAKLSYLRSHPFASQLEESLERGLAYFGLSHKADGITMTQGKETVVNEITKVKSVDLVTDPATGTLLEQTEVPLAEEVEETETDEDLREMVKKLTEQVAALTAAQAKPAPKYTKPKAAAPAREELVESVVEDAPPTDLAERRKWWMS